MHTPNFSKIILFTLLINGSSFAFSSICNDLLITNKKVSNNWELEKDNIAPSPVEAGFGQLFNNSKRSLRILEDKSA